MNAYYQPYWTNNENELEHFGIKGMKWGIRRYQNADGTLTEAGKKRYGSAENLQADRQKRKETAIKAAKVGGAIIASTAIASITGVKLDAAFNSGKGLAAIKKGSKVLAYGLSNEGGKIVNTIGSATSKALNIQRQPYKSIPLGQKSSSLNKIKAQISDILNVQTKTTTGFKPTKSSQKVQQQIQNAYREYMLDKLISEYEKQSKS